MDIIKLHNWYKTPTGHMVRRTLQGYLNELWPDLHGLRVLVIGYGMPYISLWRKEAKVFYSIPASMNGGVIGDIKEENSNIKGFNDIKQIFNEEYRHNVSIWGGILPFNDLEFDRILIIHALEFIQEDNITLKECQRVLKDDGRLIVATPNRNGAWARREISPLARGRPYSMGQLGNIIKVAGFSIVKSEFTLFTPPSNKVWIHKHSRSFEKIGKLCWPLIGGVVIAHAKKNLYSGTLVSEGAVRRGFISEPVGVFRNWGEER